jgi:hypothetical protein
VYGREPPTLLSYQPGTARVAAVDRQLQERDGFLADIKERLIQAQVTMKQYQDKSHHEVTFQVRLGLAASSTAHRSRHHTSRQV